MNLESLRPILILIPSIIGARAVVGIKLDDAVTVAVVGKAAEVPVKHPATMVNTVAIKMFLPVSMKTPIA